MAADDPRVSKAKRVLKKALTEGEKIKAGASNRATGTRSQYKRGMLAAREALAILSEKL